MSFEYVQQHMTSIASITDAYHVLPPKDFYGFRDGKVAVHPTRTTMIIPYYVRKFKTWTLCVVNSQRETMEVYVPSADPSGEIFDTTVLKVGDVADAMYDRIHAWSVYMPRCPQIPDVRNTATAIVLAARHLASTRPMPFGDDGPIRLSVPFAAPGQKRRRHSNSNLLALL